MALGRRIMAFTYSELSKPVLTHTLHQLSEDWVTFSGLADRRSLVSYIQKESIAGYYALWTKFITCVRDRDFDGASELEAQLMPLMRHDTSLVGRNFNSLLQEKRKTGWDGAFNLLDVWSRKTLANYCSM